MGEPTGSRWWDADASYNSNNNASHDVIACKDVERHTGSRVVELSADAGAHVPEGDVVNTCNGERSKSNVGKFFKGLGRKKKSSSSIADEHLDASSPAAVDEDVQQTQSNQTDSKSSFETRKGLGSILQGLGRSKKSSSNLTELPETVDSLHAEKSGVADR